MGNVQRMRRILAVLGAVAAVVAAAGIAAHYIGLVNTMVARIASFTPLFVILAMVAVLMLSAARQRVRTVLAVVIAVVGVWSQIPLFTRTDTGQPATDSVSVRLLQANIRLGEADVGALMQTVIDEDVDVLTVIELTPEALQRLSAAGITETLPYSFVRPGSSGSGAGIFARFPLTDGRRLKGFAPNNLEAVMALPGVGPVGVYALHPIPPYPEPSYKWAQELRLLRSVFAAQTHPLIVGADFNSTYDHWQYRDLLVSEPAGDRQDPHPGWYSVVVPPGGPSGFRSPWRTGRHPLRRRVNLGFRPGVRSYQILGHSLTGTPHSSECTPPVSACVCRPAMSRPMNAPTTQMIMVIQNISTY